MDAKALQGAIFAAGVGPGTAISTLRCNTPSKLARRRERIEHIDQPKIANICGRWRTAGQSKRISPIMYNETVVRLVDIWYTGAGNDLEREQQQRRNGAT